MVVREGEHEEEEEQEWRAGGMRVKTKAHDCSHYEVK